MQIKKPAQCAGQKGGFCSLESGFSLDRCGLGGQIGFAEER
jgi:hypothetical protein